MRMQITFTVDDLKQLFAAHLNSEILDYQIEPEQISGIADADSNDQIENLTLIIDEEI